MRKFACAIGALLLLIAGGAAQAASLSAVQTMTSGGHPRTFYYYKPDNFDPAKGAIIWLHAGGAAGATSFQGGTDYLWRNLADRTGVLILIPEGKPYRNDSTKHAWNDCSDDIGATKVAYTDWDDVGFIKALIPWATANVSASLDTSRIYVAGHSDGSLMAERMALEGNDAIAAVAVIAGNTSVSNDNGASYKCGGYTSQWSLTNGQATPIFLFKGDADNHIPYGDLTSEDHNTYCQIKDGGGTNVTCQSGAVHSFYDTVAFWQWKLQLSGSPTGQAAPTETSVYADTVPNCTSGFTACDGSAVVRFGFGSAPRPLIFERAYGGGHAMPGPDVETSTQYSSVGWKNRDALGSAYPYVAEEIWAFFTQFSLAY